MHQFRARLPLAWTGALLLTLLGGNVPVAPAATLTSNLLSVTIGTETAQGRNWLTASFGTNSSGYRLDSITLLLDSTDNGQAQLALYTDGLLAPGSLIAFLAAPVSYAANPTAATFTANGITLAANSTYWVVLAAPSGTFNWAWTADNTGTGVGFQHTWGTSADAGRTWFTYDTYPVQFSVAATAAAPAVPEPGTLSLLLAGGSLSGGLLLLRRWRAAGLRHPWC